MRSAIVNCLGGRGAKTGLPCTVCWVDAGDHASGVRLAELVAALSLATDLGLGQPQEHVLRQTVIARRLAAAAGLPDEQQTAVFYVSLLAWVGCVSDSHELATWFGDDQRLRADSYEVDKTGTSMLRFVLGHVGDGAGPVRRLTMIGRFLAAGSGRVARSMLGHCQTTGDIANRLGLGSQVGGALPQAFERWDGKGVPGHRAGEQIDAAMRVVQPRRRGGECGPGRRRPPRPSPANAPVRSHPAGGRDPGPAGPRPLQQGDGRAAVGVGPHGEQPRRACLRQDRRFDPGRSRHVRHAARSGRFPRRRLTGISGEQPMCRPHRPAYNSSMDLLCSGFIAPPNATTYQHGRTPCLERQ
jgi:hypothetical protein